MIFSVKIFSTALTHIVEYLALFSTRIISDYNQIIRFHINSDNLVIRFLMMRI